MSNFYLVCGISGGGKTTLSKRILKENKTLKFFDVDDYYAMINGDECDRSHTFEVWIKLYQDLHKSELKNEDVLLTTNALTVNQRRQFIEWFPSFTHHIIWVTAPKELCWYGNINRKRKVPADIFDKQWQSMEFPNQSEANWDTITQLTNWWNRKDCIKNDYIIFNLKGQIQDFIKIPENI